MSSTIWIGAAVVSIGAHLGMAAWVDAAEPATKSRPPIEMTLSKIEKPKPPLPPPPPPPPPPPKKPVVVKRVVKAAAAPPPPETPKLGIDPDSAAPGGEIAASAGTTLDTPDPGTSMKPDLPPPPAPVAPAPARPKVFPSYEVTQLPRARSRVQPEIPDAFRQAQREALVVIEVVIDVRGKVVDARVLRHADFGLDDAALAAAKATDFDPALIGTQPVSVRFQIPYRFKVRG